MSDIFNPKLRIKFLRSATIEETPVNPGNLLVDIEKNEIYLDIVASDNTVKRINLASTGGGGDLSDYYTKAQVDSTFVSENNLLELIKILDEAAQAEVDA